MRAAVGDGELPPDVNIDTWAWYYLGVLHAVLNLPQAGASPAAMTHMIDIAMSVWPAASTAKS